MAMPRPTAAQPGPTKLLERADQLAALETALADVTLRAETGRWCSSAARPASARPSLLRRVLRRAARARGSSGVPATRCSRRARSARSSTSPRRAAASWRSSWPRGAKPHEVTSALLARAGDGRARTMLVLEDLHWADEATLDVLRLLGAAGGGRAARSSSRATGTTSSTARHPLRLVLGELATSPRGRPARASRRSPPRRSRALAEAHAIDAGDLYRQHRRATRSSSPRCSRRAPRRSRRPCGTPCSRARRGSAPEARRCSRRWRSCHPRPSCGCSRPSRRTSFERVEDCLASGMLTPGRDGVAFRHELARLAVEESLTPDRAARAAPRARSRRSPPRAGGARSRAARASRRGGAATHAAVLRFAPAAAARAASLGAHREAAAQYERALRFADALPPEERAELLELCVARVLPQRPARRGARGPASARSRYRRAARRPAPGGRLAARALAPVLVRGPHGRGASGPAGRRSPCSSSSRPGPSWRARTRRWRSCCMNWEDAEERDRLGQPSARARASALDEPETSSSTRSPRIGTSEFLHGAPAAAGASSSAASSSHSAAGLDDHVGRAFLNLVWLAAAPAPLQRGRRPPGRGPRVLRRARPRLLAALPDRLPARWCAA